MIDNYEPKIPYITTSDEAIICNKMLKLWARDMTTAIKTLLRYPNTKNIKINLTFSKIYSQQKPNKWASKPLNNEEVMDWHIQMSWEYTHYPDDSEPTTKTARIRPLVGPYGDRYKENSSRHTWQRALYSVKNISRVRCPAHFGDASCDTHDIEWLDFKNTLQKYTTTWIEKSAPKYLIDIERERLKEKVAINGAKIEKSASAL